MQSEWIVIPGTTCVIDGVMYKVWVWFDIVMFGVKNQVKRSDVPWLVDNELEVLSDRWVWMWIVCDSEAFALESASFIDMMKLFYVQLSGLRFRLAVPVDDNPVTTW